MKKKKRILHYQYHQRDESEVSILGQLVNAYQPHASSCESNWSSHVRIHNKERIRLSTKNITKISKVKHVYKNKKDNQKYYVKFNF